MPIEPPSPLTSAVARLRDLAGRGRRWLLARGAGTRVGLLVLGLAALGSVGYLASTSVPTEPAWTFILERRKLSSDDLDKISEALDAAGIPHVADSSRVGVQPAKRLEALAAVKKAKVVPLSLDDLAGEPDPVNLLIEGSGDRERREKHRLEQILKAQIERLDPAITSVLVQIHRVKRRPGLTSPSDVSASDYLQTDGPRKLGHRVVVGIQRLLTKDVPELKPEAINVVDQTGHAYLAAGDPSLKAEMQAHAREEDWQDKIAEDLRHIPGVGVSVLLEVVPATPPPLEVPPAVALEVVRPNGHVDLAGPAPPPMPLNPPLPTMHTRANVWVRVPRSFYVLDFQSRSPGRQPGPEDLDLMRQTAERVIRDAVEIHIPREELGVVKVGVIQDDLASSRPMLMPMVQEPARPWTWAAVAGGGSALAVASVVALARLAGRRPSARPARSAWRSGFVADGPAGPVPGPSERVRELIRLNPEAAAGVLQRWIGQGGATG